eukprot:2141029-Alexandrium_andersonii.AAC.1
MDYGATPHVEQFSKPHDATPSENTHMSAGRRSACIVACGPHPVRKPVPCGTSTLSGPCEVFGVRSGRSNTLPF